MIIQKRVFCILLITEQYKSCSLIIMQNHPVKLFKKGETQLWKQLSLNLKTF